MRCTLSVNLSSYDIASLKNSYTFEIEGKNTRTDNIWRTGQVPMEVNTMPGLVTDESVRDNSYEDVHAVQSENSCFFMQEYRSCK